MILFARFRSRPSNPCDQEEDSYEKCFSRNNMAVPIDLPLMILYFKHSLFLLGLESEKEEPCYAIAEQHRYKLKTTGSLASANKTADFKSGASVV